MEVFVSSVQYRYIGSVTPRVAGNVLIFFSTGRSCRTHSILIAKRTVAYVYDEADPWETIARRPNQAATPLQWGVVAGVKNGRVELMGVGDTPYPWLARWQIPKIVRDLGLRPRPHAHHFG
jgi:hypothetical protein